ncbi:hypothetical protein C0214_13890 [Methylobacterium sp. DM1]|nr:hypothetical protein C0214_13890 [Methylobacterium sp. DM1]
MCAPFSTSDDMTLPVMTPDELLRVVHAQCRHATALANAVIAIAFDGLTAEEACPRKSLPELRQAFEGSFEDLREALAWAATGRKPPRGNVPALMSALKEMAEEQEIAAGLRPSDPLATAMRRVDAQEAAERSLIDRAHAVGAELSRLDAEHPYGKSAAPAHGAHEAGFHSPAAA